MSEPRPPEGETGPEPVPENGSNAPAQPGADAWPAEPPIPTAWDQSLEEYFVRNVGSFTPEALTRAAAAAGYSSEQITSAMLLAEARGRGVDDLRPVRGRARLIVLLGYALVWVFFGVQYLLLPWPSSSYVSGSLLQVILTISLVIALVVSLAWIYRTRPDPERVGRALTILLAVPIVLLVAVAGLCLPFLPVR